MPADANTANKDAYSHECISSGFWAGDENMPEPAFYSYTYPSPEGLEEEKLIPESAQWIINNDTPMAILTYADLQNREDPGETLLNFLESAYQAGARKAGWDIEHFKVPPLKEL